jgi:hypothetical protein
MNVLLAFFSGKIAPLFHQKKTLSDKKMTVFAVLFPTATSLTISTYFFCHKKTDK